MTDKNKNPQSNVSLINESHTFTRFSAPDGSGELMEVKISNRLRLSSGVMTDQSQTIILSGEDAAAVATGLRLISRELQATVAQAEARAQAQREQEAREQVASAGKEAGKEAEVGSAE